MAKIEKMKISGIRSYSPEQGGVIEFPAPLTLIVGQNGCGKTSIIESLSYIITGNLPPGCKTASSFIHDPKIAGEKEVKAQVRLQFRDITGNKLVCTRSCTSIQKLKTIQTKSLEGTILKISPNGEKSSLSSRCTDFTKEMISRLGVSKAVLENVIFCHQEDSYWPLSEGKTLKQKFDAIFAATRYIKALESIRNLRKDQGNEVKLHEKDLLHLSGLKEKSSEIKKDLLKAESQVIVCNEEMVQISHDAKPLESELKEMNRVSGEIIEVQTKLAQMESRKKELEKTIKELDQKIENRFEGSLEELKSKHREFENELNRKEMDMDDLRIIVTRLETELKNLEAKRYLIIQDQGRLEQEAKAHHSLIQERNELINKMANDFDVPGYDASSYTSRQSGEFINEMKKIYKATVDQGSDERKRFKEEIEQVEGTIKKNEKSLHGYESNIEQKRKIINTNTEKICDLSDQLNQLVASENRLQNLEKQQRKKESELKVFKQEANTGALEDEIKKLSKDKKEEETLLSHLKEEENLLLEQSEAQMKISMMESEKANKKDTFDNILRRRQEMFQEIFETRPPLDELKSKLSTFMRKCQNELKRHSEELQEVSKRLTKKESQRNMFMEQQQKMESDISKCKKKIHDTCAENSYNEFREQVQMKVEQFSNTLMEMSAFEKIYMKYIKKLEEDGDDGCPLCHRNFNSKREIKNLMDELKQKVETLPERKEATEHNLLREKELQSTVLNLAPAHNTIESLSIEIPQLSEKISKLNEEIQSEKKKLKELEEKKLRIEGKEKTARSVETDVSKIDDYLFDLKDLDHQINMEKGKLKVDVEGRSMQTVRNEVQEKEERLSTLARKVEQKRDKLTDTHKKLNDLERESNELNSHMLSLKSELQKRIQLGHQKAELSSTNQSYEREIREAANQLQPIKDILDKERERKRDLEVESEQNTTKIKDRLTKIKTQGDRIRERDEKIRKYEDEGRDTALEDNREQTEKVGERMKLKREERRAKERQIKQIYDDVTQQQLRMRELDDNVKLMEKQREIRTIDTNMKSFKGNLEDYGDYEQFQQKRNDLQEKLDKYRHQEAEIKGRLHGHEDNVKRCQRELKSTLYADADVKYCQKMIDMRTTELANQDLDKYYKALDRAIMKYHSLKLADINKIIKEYWVKTYRGNDIDTIEIVAENDEEGSGASKSRRSYNYRVSMVKRGTSLDMRGRCSAGQKVLASIIIRLALAETFCLNCGILALDEPTTNLDEQNVTSLAQSLRDIIEHRRQQKNFQLLVITHDEEFVQALGRSDYVEHYYKILKDDNQHSRIRRVGIRE